MTKTITVFDNQAKPKYGAKFNGSIEETDTYETIGYLDFLSPAAYYKRLDETEKEKVFDLVSGAEKANLPVYLSSIKDPVSKNQVEDAMAVLIVRGEGVFTVDVKMNGEFGDEIWLQQNGNHKNRYVGFDNSDPKSNLGTKLAV